jgi:hypothetical protein
MEVGRNFRKIGMKRIIDGTNDSIWSKNPSNNVVKPLKKEDKPGKYCGYTNHLEHKCFKKENHVLMIL